MKNLSLLETIDHLEGEGDIARLTDPVDFVEVETGHPLPLVVLVYQVFWQSSAPVYV